MKANVILMWKLIYKTISVFKIKQLEKIRT